MHNFAGKFVSPSGEVFNFFMAALQYQKIKPSKGACGSRIFGD